MQIRVGTLLAGSGRVLGDASLAAIAYIAAMTLIGSAIDRWASEGASNIGYTAASVIGGYYLLHAMLAEAGCPVVVPGKRLSAYFGMSLLSGLGILVGLVLLIVPGVILLVRWLPAYAILLSEDLKVTDALGASWVRTDGHFWPLLGAVLIVAVIMCVGIIIAVLCDVLFGEANAFAIVLANLVVSSMTVLFTALGVASYAMLTAVNGEESEVVGD